MTPAELPYELIEAKLAPLELRPDTVAKTELIDRFRASSARAASVVAPAGFGKTTLLAHLAELDGRSFAMVALDERDNDPVVLLRYVTAALDRVEPVPVPVFEALSTPGRSVWATCVPRLCAALSAAANPVVLVLDDVHLVSDPTCMDVVAALIDHIPERSRIVLSSREEPALPLPLLRSQGRVLEIGAGDLRLNVEEAAALLRNAGVDLDDAAVAELVERTEGWPAGLYLAALSLQAGRAGPQAVQAFGGDDRFVTDYLRSELLAQLTDQEVRFLTRTSVLDRMCGGLCDAVVGQHDSSRELVTLERRNHFVVPLERSRTWYRYHHLFRDLLRSELGLREPEIARELNRRAMAWCERNGMAEPALHYAHEAGDTDAVTRLIEQLLLPAWYSGRVATVESWLAWYDDALLRRYPTIAVLGAWVYFLTGRPAEGARCERAAQMSTASPVLPDGSASIEPWIAALRTSTCPDGIESMLADAELTFELSPDGWFRPAAQLAAGVAHVLLGDPDRGREALLLASEIAASAGASEDGTAALAELAFVAMEADSWDEAAVHAARAVSVVEKAGLDDYIVSGLALAATARIAIQHGDVRQAREDVARIHRVRPLLNHGLPWLSVQIGLELTRLHLALGEAGVAGTVLGEAEAILRVRPRLGTLAVLARELRQRVAATSIPSGQWAMSLTAAELRLLPLLTTHLAFPQIGERLFLSRTTIKTQASSIYRKFGVASRDEAIERAVELGLLEDSRYPARADTITSR
ncbi:LuxR C-terminal-related transcriptional regulator [Solirubrobacter ginsenosidimutans]|uniref:LuxR C-terminal-related transcriptional regulator n=1 Tax=Solirubrobacter ginsenosidimutans TaxID=490573 RepID=A0A9X3S591_9ACTN|nr:LuxR C-terminal-related transcriptional regulator [Solirubrobacter ginsenosidimutans]MDA0161383.1 LuxR C-terminal-related transcriptional regulator [Solirubrobacter ginsenosidimutans]